jgi:hypothetical protein
MVKVIVAYGNHLSPVCGFRDAFSKIVYGSELDGMRRQAEAVRTERNSSVQERFNVRRLNHGAHGPDAEAFRG